MNKKGIIGIVIASIIAIVAIIVGLKVCNNLKNIGSPSNNSQSESERDSESVEFGESISVNKGVTVQLNQSFNGRLEENGEEDWFNFTVEKDGYISIEFSHPIIDSTKSHWTVKLFEQDAITYYGGESFYWSIGGKTTEFTTCNMGVGAGKYHIKVEDGEKYSTFQYGVKINYVEASNWETEINSTSAKSDEIEINVPKYGTSICYAEEDWYIVDIPNNGYVTISVEHPVLEEDSSYWMLYLYESNGITQYADEDKSWYIYGQKNLTTTKMGVSAGKYYIKMWGRGAGSWTDKEYSITVNFTEADNWETESNKTVEKADEIEINVPKYGASICWAEEDWYVVDIPSNGYITISVEHPVLEEDSSCWTMYLYESNGITQYADEDVWWYVYGQKNLTTTKMGVSAGKYYIKLRGRGAGEWSNKEYSITVNFIEANNWETEINSTSEKADEITIGVPKHGTSICWAEDDWYVVDIPSNGYITISVEHPVLEEDSSYWMLYLYESNGITQYADEDKSWYIYGQKNLTTTKMGVSAGKYYIKIWGRGAGSWTDKEYSITVNFTEADNWETESNKTAEKATELPVNTQMSGTIFYEDDIDWYKIEIPEDGKISISFDHPNQNTSSACWDLRLYMSDAITRYAGVDFKWYMEGNVTTNQTYDLGVAEGIYYLKISSSDRYYSTDEYKLTINYTVTPNWEKENNGTKETACEVGGNTVYGSIVVSGDYDWYKLYGDGSHYLKFNHPNINTSSTCWKVVVYAADGSTVLASKDVKGNSGDQTISFNVYGLYYVKVTAGTYNIWEGDYNTSGATYNFTLY